MHLKSIQLKGFKSFPERTRLDFGPGVSVVVGPNGSGKSNVTDAVLWAMGEQSPLAVRGQSMQDVIFGGGRGVQARSQAEVEIVLDNGDGTVDLPASEISILRRLDRSGEGEYRLNGARCRLVDVIEVLSDTGLGKEMHSVISQGRVEAIVTSKARDRRLLIEEAAGLGKHRKRRRRAQLKLERTQENLDRALDVEREARSRLRPLKRQAEAAELHARLERQVLEVRWELGRDAMRARREELARAEAQAQSARADRDRLEAQLGQVIARRERAEQALAARSERRDAITRRVYGARSAAERLEMRAEQVRATGHSLAARVERAQAELSALAELTPPGEDASGAPDGRIAELQAELEVLDREREQELERELREIERDREQAQERLTEAEAELQASRVRRSEADAQADGARAARQAADATAEAARREAARVGAELAAVNHFLRSQAAAPGGSRTLGDELQVRDGYELALAAALGGRLSAGLAADRPGAGQLLDRAGPDGGSALVGEGTGPRPAADADAAPIGARRLIDYVTGSEPAYGLACRLLEHTWLVQRIEDLPPDFRGVAVTVAGRVWSPLPGSPAPSGGSGQGGELRQVAAGGSELILARRNERDRLVGHSERAAQAELSARARADAAATAVVEADRLRDAADHALRDAGRRHADLAELLRHHSALIDQRRRSPQEGPAAVRRAELEGELAAERRQAERVQRERAEREVRRGRLQARCEADVGLMPTGERLRHVLDGALTAVRDRVALLEAELTADRAAGEGVAAELRACGGAEAELHSRLRATAEEVTTAEVGAQRLRDQAHEVGQELDRVAQKLGLDAEPAAQALEPEQAAALALRLERLRRRGEQLGPVNPLAQDEYAQALAHVEELEGRRADLETALRELRTLIRDTDRQIQETFEETFSAAARNFAELVGDVFPGGGGRLRLVREDAGPRPVLGGQSPGVQTDVAASAATEATADAEAEAEAEAFSPEEMLGVEIEVTPAGKSTKRLSLLSGGEKSMTALAFLFAVFLAKPCPFYILDEVEAALDDLNLDRFLSLLRRHSGRAQFIVITHQKRTMEAADWLYGVSMGGDGVSKVISRRLPPEVAAVAEAGAA